MAQYIRCDWTLEEVLDLFSLPIKRLRERAQTIHRLHGDQDVQKCMLLSIKTGACPEDCGYCSQSAHYKTDLTPSPLMSTDLVLQKANEAKALGATRFCLGAAWKEIPKDRRFDAVLQMIRGVSAMGLEVCCTLGAATTPQLEQLRDAGLTAYNHNLDTSRDFYPRIISTHTYDARLNTLRSARAAGVQLCCGGILGLGEKVTDRASLLVELANMSPQPESVPINLLVPIEGTPLEDNQKVPFDEFLRMVAVARILMPRARIRLSAGRNQLTPVQQQECFEAGANSIFIGEKLLTTANVPLERDFNLLDEVAN